MAEQPTLAELIERHQKKCFNEQDRQLVQQLIDNDETDELRRRMQPRITFGTSGLRAAVGPGFARMNDLTVYMATRGLALYLQEQVPHARERGVVVGHDHRHGSASFARITRQTLAHAGFKVYTFDRLVHTPLVPYAVRRLRASAGVMVTASHNPKQDNGYKVYWETGCAIVPPHDAGISAQIDACAQTDPAEPLLRDEPGKQVFDEIYPQYLADVLQLVQPVDGSSGVTNSAETCSGVRVAYTPMHGVGLPFARDVASRLGATLVEVAQQAQPDPEFPTVKFPNPEEIGALSLAQSVAEAAGCSVVVANDPDADRFCFAERQSDGRWRQFTGNEIGCLLAEAAIARTASSSSSERKRKRACLSSAVSSRALQSLCRAHGVHWEETLTGFKWLGSRALSLLEDGGYDVVFAYEEAIGYMPGPPVVYDKDGVATLAAFLTLLARLAKEGKTLAQQLADFYGKYGSSASRNGYFRIADAARLRQVVAQLRKPYKASLTLSAEHFHGDGRTTEAATAAAATAANESSVRKVAVSRVRDLTTGFDSATTDERPPLPTDGASEMITYWFDLSSASSASGGVKDAESEWATMTVRGSGTEPKLKYYIECATAGSVADAQRTADRIEAALSQDWLRDYDLDRVS